MSFKNLQPFWNSERIGLALTAASLLVVSIAIGLLSNYQKINAEKQIRSQGLSLVRLLTGMPYQQLIPADGNQNILQLIRDSGDNRYFAYAVIVDTQGNALRQTTAPGILVPPTSYAIEPTGWIGERTLKISKTDQQILEFYSPLLNERELAGHIRLGFLQPTLGFTLAQLPFIGTLALLIFMLAPLSYFFIKREAKTIRSINNQLDSLLSKNNNSNIEFHPSDELGKFIHRFNQFFDQTQSRIQALESEQAGFVTSTKLISYKRARIEAVLQSLPESIIVLDESETIMYANTKLVALLGMPLSEIIGKKIRKCFENLEISEFLSQYKYNQLTKASGETIEFSPSTAPEKTIRVMIYPLFAPNNDHSTFGTMIVFRDVTIEAIAKEGRSEFVAHIAHELKSPLNVLAMYSESLLGEDGQSKEFRVEAFNVIHDEVERINTLINNLLNLTQVEMGSMIIDKQRVKLRDLLKDSFENISRNARWSSYTFTLDLPKELSAIVVDKTLFRVAVNNLLTNAIKYNKPNGSIKLSVDETDKTIFIRVRDTGIGIADEDKDKIFNKFYRSAREESSSRPGHGLGLSLAQEIINLHHSKLYFTSIVNEGTEFVIEVEKETGAMSQAI